MMRTAILVAAALALAGCTDSSDTQMMTLLGTGFLQGYNGARQAQPVVSTHCTTVGVVTNCVAY